MRGFPREEEIRYNEIRLSFVLAGDEECLFFAQKRGAARFEKKNRESNFFRTHKLKFLTHKQQKTRVFSFSIHFVLATNMFTLSTSATVSSVSLSRLLSRARFPVLGFFFFSRFFLSPVRKRESKTWVKT